MPFTRSLARQLAEPSGVAGALCGTAMDFANRVPLKMAIDMLCPGPGETLLDAGCGTGAASEEMLRRADCHIMGVDQSATMIRRARSRLAKPVRDGAVELHQAKLEERPCPPGSVDGVLALNVLYFCDPDGGMIRALRTTLRPGGRLLAYVTHRSTMEKWAFTGAGFHRLYDEHQLKAALIGGGFDPAHILIEARAIAAGVQGLFALAHVQ